MQRPFAVALRSSFVGGKSLRTYTDLPERASRSRLLWHSHAGFASSALASLRVPKPFSTELNPAHLPRGQEANFRTWNRGRNCLRGNEHDGIIRFRKIRLRRG